MANSLVYGIHAVQAIIEKHPDQLVELLLLSGSQSNVRLQKLAQSARSRVKRNPSTSVSQERNRGHARVQLVQPFSPWPQPPGPSSDSRWNGL